MADTLHELVRRRSRNACEYCRLAQRHSPQTHEMDHIIAAKHRGPTIAGNLALACYWCSKHKSCNISGIDPKSGKITRLFHPRVHKWSAHFRWDGPMLVGRTDIGRTTVEVLEINLPHRVAMREALIDEGVFPP